MQTNPIRSDAPVPAMWAGAPQKLAKRAVGLPTLCLAKLEGALLGGVLLVAGLCGAASYHQTVTFRLVSGPDNGSYIVQPMLPMRLRIQKLDSSAVLREDRFARCTVFNAKQEDTAAHVKCDGVEFRVTGLQFELDTPVEEQP